MARKKCQSAAWIPLFSPCTSTRPISSTSICSKPSGRSSCAQDIFVKGLSCVRSDQRRLPLKGEAPLGTRRIRRPPGFSFQAILRLTSKSSGRVRCSKISKAMIASNAPSGFAFRNSNPSAWFSLADERFAAVWSKASDRSTPVRSLS